MNNALVPVSIPNLSNPDPGQNGMFRGNAAGLEARLGQQNMIIPNLGRIQSPEDSNADGAWADPVELVRNMIVMAPTIIPIDGAIAVFTSDYNTLSNYEYIRRGADDVGAEGRNDQKDYPFIAAGATGNFAAGSYPDTPGMTPFSSPNLILGVQVEWGLSILDFAPFTMTVKTVNFKGRCYQPVDRKVTLRFENARSGTGGIFQLLFAQRLSYNDSCGCGGYGAYGAASAYAATGGMQKAIVQPAVVPGQYGDEADAGLVVLPPFSVGSPNDLPYVQLTIPANLASAFTATCHLLSAASPYLAGMRERLQLDGAPQQP